MDFTIQKEDPRKRDVTELIQTHFEFCMASVPPENVYALNVEKLCSPEITLFGARSTESGVLLGIGALRKLDNTHGELKTMHTAKFARGKGIGTAIVNRILTFSRTEGMTRISLESGFEEARKLYAKVGFKNCDSFGDYITNNINVCMTLDLLEYYRILRILDE